MSLENVQIGEAAFKRFSAEFRAAGFNVGEEHLIDPATGQVTYMTVSADTNVNWTEARAIFARLNAANISIGIGSSLRLRLWEGVNSGAIKLHDFGFRGRQ